MPTFICDRCHSIENTANCLFHNRGKLRDHFGENFKNNEMICSGCTPKKYADGTHCSYGGWHNRFPRQIATLDYAESARARLKQSKGLQEVLNKQKPKVTLKNIPLFGEVEYKSPKLL